MQCTYITDHKNITTISRRQLFFVEMESLPGEDERVVFRVIPKFKSKYVKLLSGLQISSSLIIAGLGIAVFIVKAFTSVGGMSFLATAGLLTAGILGFVASYRKEVWAISVHFILAVVGLAFCLALIGAGVTALHFEVSRNSTHSQTTREAIDICAISMGAFGTVLTLVSVGFCCFALFYGCCRTSPAATYINEPIVPYEATLDDIKLGETANGVEKS